MDGVIFSRGTSARRDEIHGAEDHPARRRAIFILVWREINEAVDGAEIFPRGESAA